MLGKLALWFKGLSALGKTGVVTSALVAGSVAASPSPPPEPPAPETQQSSIQSEPQDVVETETATETEEIAFSTKEVESANLPDGETQITQNGVAGERTIIYEITYTNGTETGRKKISEEVTKQPIDKITTVGTYVAPAPEPEPASNCDPNYTGGCVPIASDVDCGGGSGNGPAYFYGTARVVGYDKYGLDRDNDGLACE